MLPVSRGFIPIPILIVGAVLALVSVGGAVYYVSVYSPSEASTKTATRPVGFTIPTPAGQQEQPSQPLVQQSQDAQVPVESPVPSPLPSPVPTPDATTLTYSSSEAGYSFKYPFDWTVVEGSTACGPVFYPQDTDKTSLTVCGLNANADDTPALMAERAIGSSLSSLVSKNSMTVGKHSSVRQETSITSGQYEIDVFVGNVSNKSKTLTGTLAIYFSIQDSTKIESMKKQFDTILSSFKFTI